MPGPAVFQDPAGLLKVLHTAPEVDGEPQPKKLCALPSSDPSSKAKVYRCNNCTGEYCVHAMTGECILVPYDCYDDDSDDEIEFGEYQGKRDGYAWNCLLGCCDLTVDCSFNHGESKTNAKYGVTKGLYVIKECYACGECGHFTDECSKSIKPTSFIDVLDQLDRDRAAADAAMGEEIDNTST